jgi:hypothetical protein
MTAKTIDIHGKEYTPVSERVKLYHEDNESDMMITTSNRIEEGYVIVEAEVRTRKGLFHGTSAVHIESAKKIESENPFEVAETSAIGRALGFANYGLTDSIASADEINKSQTVSANGPHPALQKAQAIRETRQEGELTCATCGAPATVKSGVSAKTGKPWSGVFCSADREHVKWGSVEDKGKPQLEPKDEHLGEVDPEAIPF